MGLVRSFQENPYAQAVVASPFISLVSTFVLTCLITRIVTGLRSTIAQNNTEADKKTPNRIAYWVPFVGSAISFARDIEGTISKDRDLSGDGIFSYRLGPSIYYVVNMPSLVQQIFAQRGTVLNKQKILEWFMKTTFEDNYATRDEHKAFHGHHNALNLMLKEDFINEATGKTARTVEVEAARFVTSAPWATPDAEGKPMQLWEEAGKVKFNTDGSFDANLYQLTVHYMGQIVIDMLWGKALIKNHPNLQTDMWDFDEGVHHIVTTLLAKVTAAGRKAVAARNRLAVAMKEWHEAVAVKQSGEKPDAKWGALDDISQIMQDRVKVWVDAKASETLQKTNDTSVLWGVNVNSNKNVFWMLLQIHTKPELLARIREEVAPYVHLSKSGAKGPDGLPKLDIDVDGLMKHCPLLRAAFYETMRMNMSGLGIRQVIKDLTLKESAADAAMFGKRKPQSYTIPAGTTLVLANGTMQMDQRIFAEPEKFKPERFIEEGPDGAPRVNMKNLHTFGGGMYKCKGRYFAEKEIMIFSSSLLVMWDIAPAEGDELVIPKMGFAGASRSPVEDIRVRLTRRYE
ncbi:cytochrome P450 [Aaosphaeria arxii CBS 175.79]|uniref:Cytochrome P450 n=1 Tax=Aaosphaeria arxii CBS 175.79 TaxID=1450172 RepID=A0A6A5X7D9_9PLEO|nr:cytochrome P450 [Aaosphaeria arxii CBS 175.79]KAF2008830.1 cytochrome P450 [Aaosphaeria arxii CBS 175.79]